MPAMHDSCRAEVLGQLARYFDIAVGTTPFEMSHDECIRLIAPPEHIQLLTTAADIAHLSAHDDWVPVTVPTALDGVYRPTCMLQMRTHADKRPPLRPRLVLWQPDQTVAANKVKTWLQKRLELGRRFGTARYVINALIRDCDNGHQLRYMFPPIMHLAKKGNHDRLDRWIDKHGAYRACKYTPAISPAFKKALQDSATLLTQMALIGDDVPTREKGFVDISDYDNHRFQIEGVEVARM